MAGQYFSVPDGQHDIHLQFQSTPPLIQSRPNSPPKPRFQGLPARRRSKVKLWLGIIGKWSETVAIVLVIYVILVVYAIKDVMSQKEKKYFNALITGSLIALGLSTMSQLTGAVQDLKWWILSKRPRSRQKVNAILEVSSMTETLALAFKSSRWTIHIAVAAWVSLFLAIQVGYASLGLCYSVEKTEDVALMVSGKVSMANLTTIFPTAILNATQSATDQEYAANNYGVMSLALREGGLDDIPDSKTLFFADNNFLFCDDYCSYVFRETNTETVDNPYKAPVIALTDRRVDIRTNCSAYRVHEGGNGTSNTIVVEQNSRKTPITLPSSKRSDRKVYMTSANQTCGSDCSIVSVFEASSTDPWFYNCTISLGPVLNAKKPEHEIGPSLARLATSAIALGGFGNEGDIRTNSYPTASVFGMPLNGSTDAMHYILSRFAIGVLAAVVESNTDIVMDGQQPTIGQKLNVSHWGIITLILWVTTFLQLIVAIVATKVSEKVVVPPRDSLSEAQILRAMVVDGIVQEEAKVEGQVPKVRSLWIYRNQHVDAGLYDLYMEEVRA
ncbi:Ff.00g116410.m01.CDS01 [Fusarium sp. VM40]|nr:Ff.00g116410.m01.CDS01 [Fusarium sp. VM40]